LAAGDRPHRVTVQSVRPVLINLLFNFLVPLEAQKLQERTAITLVATAKDPNIKNPTIGIGFDLKAGGPAVRYRLSLSGRSSDRMGSCPRRPQMTSQ
jgi:hypothetical protein